MCFGSASSSSNVTTPDYSADDAFKHVQTTVTSGDTAKPTSGLTQKANPDGTVEPLSNLASGLKL